MIKFANCFLIENWPENLIIPKKIATGSGRILCRDWKATKGTEKLITPEAPLCLQCLALLNLFRYPLHSLQVLSTIFLHSLSHFMLSFSFVILYIVLRYLFATFFKVILCILFRYPMHFFSFSSGILYNHSVTSQTSSWEGVRLSSSTPVLLLFQSQQMKHSNFQWYSSIRVQVPLFIMHVINQ